MNRNVNKKVKRSMRRTCSLLLAALMLSSCVFASGTDRLMLGDSLPLSILYSADKYEKEHENHLRELYGEDWDEVDALQPGESYMGERFLYICHEETSVRWERVKSIEDLDGSTWKKDHLLLLTNTSGTELYLGNDYVNDLKDGSYGDGKHLNASSPYDTRLELDNNSAKQIEVSRYPELREYMENKTGNKYPYPDTFWTVGTMNAPYLHYMGKDEDNDDNPMFRLILADDTGVASPVGVGLDSGDDILELESAKRCNPITFEMRTVKQKTFLNPFFNVDNEGDVYLIREGSKLTSTEEEPESESFIAFVGRKNASTRIEMIDLEGGVQDPNALENVYGGKVEFYKWNRVTSTDQLNQTYQKGARMMLVWNDQYFISGDNFRMKNDEVGMALYANEGVTNAAVSGSIEKYPELKTLNLSGNTEFYTATGMGTPYIYRQGKDDDKDNDYCETFTIQLAGADDQPSGKWLCDADNKLGICAAGSARLDSEFGGQSVTEEHRVGIILGREGDSDNDARDGYCKLFFKDTPSKYDTGFFHDGNVLYGYDDWADWDYGEFKLFIGTKVTYPAVRQNYIVGEDQFMHISQNGAMLNNVIITVRKGGVLSIESWFMNNGRIIVDGGTLIVQDSSTIMPYLDINPAVSGSLELRNGGELIVMKNAKAAFSNISVVSASSVVNNGLLLAETVTLNESTLENRKGMDMFVGYDFRETSAFRNGSTSQIIGDLATRLNAEIPSLTVGPYTSIRNDGTIRHSTRREYVDIGTWHELSSGEYIELRGRVS